jgi:hypothetical protein
LAPAEHPFSAPLFEDRRSSTSVDQLLDSPPRLPRSLSMPCGGGPQDPGAGPTRIASHGLHVSLSRTEPSGRRGVRAPSVEHAAPECVQGVCQEELQHAQPSRRATLGELVPQEQPSARQPSCKERIRAVQTQPAVLETRVVLAPPVDRVAESCSSLLLVGDRGPLGRAPFPVNECSEGAETGSLSATIHGAMHAQVAQGPGPESNRVPKNAHALLSVVQPLNLRREQL